MFWTAFVWGIGATAGGSIGLMLLVVLFAVWSAVWSRVAKTPAAVRANELAELTYNVMVERKDLSAKQLDTLDLIAYHLGTVAEFTESLEKVECDLSEEIGDDDGGTDTGTDPADLCDHPHYSGLEGLGGFEG